MKSRQIVSLIGSAAVIVGCFMPIVTTPEVDHVHYMFSPNHAISGAILIALAIVGMIGAYRNSNMLLIASASLVALVFTLTLLRMLGLQEVFEDLLTLSVPENSFKSGAVTIPAGLFIMFVSSLMTIETPTAEKRRTKIRKSHLREDNIHREQVRRMRHENRKSTTKTSSIFSSRSKHRKKKR